MSERITLADLFKEEFADVLRVARRVSIPRVSVARTAVPWALLAGFGAAFFASGLCRIALSLLLGLPRRVESALPTTPEVATAVGTAVGIAVAWRAGGWLAAEGYVGFLALGRVLTVPTLQRFCESASGGPLAGTPVVARCSLEGQIAPLIPTAIGVVLAVAPVPVIARSVALTNGVLESAGALSLAQGVWFNVVQLAVPPLTAATPADTPVFAAIGVGGAVVAGVIGGFVIARRARRPWRGYAVIALVVLFEWALFSLRGFVASLAYGALDQLGLAGVLSLVSPVFLVAALAITLVSSRAPRSSAA